MNIPSRVGSALVAVAGLIVTYEALRSILSRGPFWTMPMLGALLWAIIGTLWLILGAVQRRRR